MKITFNSENGFYPYCIYKKIKFFIKDEKDYRGNWQYMLCSANKDTKTIEFNNYEEAIGYLEKIEKSRYLYRDILDKKVAIKTNNKIYVAVDNKVTIRNDYKILSSEFDSYIDCLNYSKKYIERFISEREKQLSLL